MTFPVVQPQRRFSIRDALALLQQRRSEQRADRLREEEQKRQLALLGFNLTERGLPPDLLEGATSIQDAVGRAGPALAQQRQQQQTLEDIAKQLEALRSRVEAGGDVSADIGRILSPEVAQQVGPESFRRLGRGVETEVARGQARREVSEERLRREEASSERRARKAAEISGEKDFELFLRRESAKAGISFAMVRDNPSLLGLAKDRSLSVEDLKLMRETNRQVAAFRKDFPDGFKFSNPEHINRVETILTATPSLAIPVPRISDEGIFRDDLQLELVKPEKFRAFVLPTLIEAAQGGNEGAARLLSIYEAHADPVKGGGHPGLLEATKRLKPDAVPEDPAPPPRAAPDRRAEIQNARQRLIDLLPAASPEEASRITRTLSQLDKELQKLKEPTPGEKLLGVLRDLPGRLEAGRSREISEALEESDKVLKGGP